jgi:hypothetical protein
MSVVAMLSTRRPVARAIAVVLNRYIVSGLLTGSVK